jgi:hypothetical protein
MALGFIRALRIDFVTFKWRQIVKTLWKIHVLQHIRLLSQRNEVLSGKVYNDVATEYVILMLITHMLNV